MMTNEQYKGKYRIESSRLRGWDYTAAGYYFVTICTKDMKPYFGRIIDGCMTYSPAGDIVAKEWLKAPQIRPYVELDEWVLMPNHQHGIIVINESNVETSRRDVSTTGTDRRDVATGIPRLQPGSLGSIINQFKSVCTKRIRRMGYSNFAWQPRYYDHIIRNQNGLDKIRRYIIENPLKWELDKYYSRN